MGDLHSTNPFILVHVQLLLPNLSVSPMPESGCNTNASNLGTLDQRGKLSGVTLGPAGPHRASLFLRMQIFPAYHGRLEKST